MENANIFVLSEKIPYMEGSSSEEEYFQQSNQTDSDRSKSIKERISELECHGKRVASNLKMLNAKRCKLLEQVELLFEEIGSCQKIDSEVRECRSVYNISSDCLEGESCESSTLDRCRGGVDHPGKENSSEKCDTSCIVCLLETSGNSSCRCCELAQESLSRFDEPEDIPMDIYFDTMIPAKVAKMRKVGRLQENLEQLKNCNHCLKKLLRQCSCSTRNPGRPSLSNQFCKEANESCEISQNAFKECKSDLIVTIKILQSKCRTKDRIILTMVNELRNGASLEQATRILENLAQADIAESVEDFDRTTLWRHLAAISPAATPTYKRVFNSEYKRNICIIFFILSLIFGVTLLYLYEYLSFKICSYNILLSISSKICHDILARIIDLFSISNSHLLSKYTCVIFNLLLNNHTDC